MVKRPMPVGMGFNPRVTLNWRNRMKGQTKNVGVMEGFGFPQRDSTRIVFPYTFSICNSQKEKKKLYINHMK